MRHGYFIPMQTFFHNKLEPVFRACFENAYFEFIDGQTSKNDKLITNMLQ